MLLLHLAGFGMGVLLGAVLTMWAYDIGFFKPRT